MTKYISKRGFYSVEAAIILPLLILAVLTLGYFIKADSAWETAMHDELNNCSYKAAINAIGVHTKKVSSTVSMSLPLGFGREYERSGRIKYRDFKGNKYDSNGMGADALETDEDKSPVWVFPLSGERYHKESCTYVKATVHSCVLSSSIKDKYDPCGLCHSSNMATGSIAFCFNGENTSYHYGYCRSINRHIIVIDKSEAIKKGYTQCSKCTP